MTDSQIVGGVLSFLLTSISYFMLYYIFVFPELKRRDSQETYLSVWHCLLTLFMAGGIALTFILASSANGEQQLAFYTTFVFGLVYFCCNEIGITILRQSLTKPIPDLSPFSWDVVQTYQRRMTRDGV